MTRLTNLGGLGLKIHFKVLTVTAFVLLVGIAIADTQTGNLVVNVKYEDGIPVWNASVSVYNDSSKSVLRDSGRTNDIGQFVNNTPLECDRTYWLEVKMAHDPIYFGPDYLNENCTANANVTPLKGDLTGNCSVDILDLIIIGQAYGSTPQKPNWNSFADIKKDNIINIFDLSILGKNYGKGEGNLSTFYQDKDGDGYGNASVYVQACVVQPGYVSNNTDCDDTDSGAYPGVPVKVTVVDSLRNSVPYAYVVVKNTSYTETNQTDEYGIAIFGTLTANALYNAEAEKDGLKGITTFTTNCAGGAVEEVTIID